jgi:ribosomal protein S18 acetylase RimI-like enzyme
LGHAGEVIGVRDADVDDADAIATAHIDGWRVGYRGVVPDEYLDADEFATVRRDRWRSWTWRQFVPDSRLFVVTLQGRVVGFGHTGPEQIAAHGIESPTAESGDARGEIYGFYLHPTAWGSGGAGALMSRCEEFMRDEGFSSAVLWVMRDNPRARAFYEKAGWHATGQESTFTPSNASGSSLPEVTFVVSQYEVRL